MDTLRTDRETIYCDAGEPKEPYVSAEFARQLERENNQLREVADAILEWIDAVPKDTELPPMPGFDRDWVDSVSANAQTLPPEGAQ